MAALQSSRRRAVRALTVGLAALGLALLAGSAGAATDKVAGGIRFTYLNPTANAVFWASDFNGWSASANPMTKSSDGMWSVVIALPPGECQYKYVVDGTWFADPDNSATVGEFGNSVVRVSPAGDLAKLAATSNTSYNPKIVVDGRMIGLFQSIHDASFSRYELTRPTLDIDLGFGVRISDLLRAHILTNINPAKEDVQDYRSRLNYKRGSLEFQQPDLRIVAFDSEPIGAWDDPARLVGDIGVFRRPFGYRRVGFDLTTPRLGFDTEVLYADNSQPGGTEFPGHGDNNRGLDYSIDRGQNRRFVFEGDALARALGLLKQVRIDTTHFAVLPNQKSRVSTTDVGDNDQSFGFGDGNADVFAGRVGRRLPGGFKVGVLGRTTRGYNLGRLTLAEVGSDPGSFSVTYGQTEQQWFALGGEAAFEPRPGLAFHAEYLQGARRLDLMDRGTRDVYVPATDPSKGRDSLVSRAGISGQHYNLDESRRVLASGSWTFAEGDISLRSGFELQQHRHPAWSQPPVSIAGLPNADHPRFENVDFQRADYTDLRDLENRMTTWQVGADRDWRYYLGRRVKTSMDLEFTNFKYDPRTVWEYQLWFPTGNMWLESGQHLVRLDRLTVLGEKRVVTVRPMLEVPIAARRDVRFKYWGTYTGVTLGLRPRYAESLARFGADVTRTLRFTVEGRHAKYDAPTLALAHAYTSVYTEMSYRFAPGVQLSFGYGVDPWIIDPATNEYAYIGRDQYLFDRNANGYIAETDYLSLAPQIAAAEKALQLERRLQFKAVVRF